MAKTQLPKVALQASLSPAGRLYLEIVKPTLNGSNDAVETIDIYLTQDPSLSLVTAYKFTITPLPEESIVKRTIMLSDVSSELNDQNPLLAINAENVSSNTTDPNGFTSSGLWPSFRFFPSPFNILTESTSFPTNKNTVFVLSSTETSVDRVQYQTDTADPSTLSLWKTYSPGYSFQHSYSESGIRSVKAILSADVVSSTNGSSYLRRESFLQIDVKPQPFFPTAGFVSWLGLANPQGLDIADPKNPNFTFGNYALICKGFAVAESTQEGKLFISTARSKDGSTNYQTLAWDVFPLPGRPKIPRSLSINSRFDTDRVLTDASLYDPVRIQGTSLSNLKTGQDILIQFSALGGKPPYTFYTRDLPPGLMLTGEGQLVGSPTKAGAFTSHISAQDSQVPPQKDVKDLFLYIEPDLLVKNPGYQYSRIAQFYQLQLVAQGGQEPYFWSLGAGSDLLTAFGFSLSSDGILSGTPSDRGEHQLPFRISVTVLLEDSAGSLAEATFEIGVYPPALEIKRRYLEEMFDGEFSEQVIYAIGGDGVNYSWSFEAADNSPLPTAIGFTYKNQRAVISYNPDLHPRSSATGDNTPEAHIPVRLSVQSGSGANIDYDSKIYDLIISNSLAPLVIKESYTGFPVVVPTVGADQILTAFVPDPRETANPLRNISFSNHTSNPSFVQVETSGKLKISPNVTAKGIFPVRVLLDCKQDFTYTIPDPEDSTTVMVKIDPVGVTLANGQSRTFTATVTGSPNTAVVWSATSGSVSGLGEYTAPAQSGVYIVKATSQADPTKYAQASVTVISEPVPVIATFYATPSSTFSGSTVRLVWAVSGAVTVKIDGVDVTGLTYKDYVVTNSKTFTLTAQNTAGTASATTSVTTQAATINPITPANPTVTKGGVLRFSSSMNDGSGISWFASSGAIAPDGSWTAPMVSGSAVITAKSTNNPQIVTTTNATVIDAAVITSFTFSSTIISLGQSVTITPVFSGGTGVVTTDQGGTYSVTSGVGITHTPTTSTNYTLSVTNAGGTLKAYKYVEVKPTVTLTLRFNVDDIDQTGINTFSNTITGTLTGANSYSQTISETASVAAPLPSGHTLTLSLLPGTYSLHVNMITRTLTTWSPESAVGQGDGVQDFTIVVPAGPLTYDVNYYVSVEGCGRCDTACDLCDGVCDIAHDRGACGVGDTAPV